MLNLKRATRKALVLSPAASHPQDYGNRRRVYQTTKFFQDAGYEIHFLLYPMEPDWMSGMQGSAREMRDEWDSFSIIPSSRPIPLQTPAIGEYHQIDEWWDSSIETYLTWLFARDHFDLFIVNYAFLAKAFEYAPDKTIKILETHDRFSGRKELLTALGARIESFYTTEAEESIALDRSDFVIAIKDTEAEFYRGLTDRKVISIPYWNDDVAPVTPHVTTSKSQEFRAGFIGALNVVNVANMQSFIDTFESHGELQEQAIKICIAGEVCAHLRTTGSNVLLLGRVESLEEFYNSVDVIIVPMMLSTGLKIKVGEALSFGKAVVATENGFDGFPPTDEFHTLDSMDAVCRALSTLARDPDRLRILEWRTASSAELARERALLGYRDLLQEITLRPRTLVFITDSPIAEKHDVTAERRAQWCQLFSQMGTTIVISLAPWPTAQSRWELQTADILEIPDTPEVAEAVMQALDELGNGHGIVEIVLSVRTAQRDKLWQNLRQRYDNITLDAWSAEPSQTSSDLPLSAGADLWISPSRGDSSSARAIYATALRYRPSGLDIWKNNPVPKGAIVVRCGLNAQARAGCEYLTAKNTEVFPVNAVNLLEEPSTDLDKDFYGSLKNLSKPQIILALGADEHAIALCESVARSFDIPCIRITGNFPYPVVRHDQVVDLCSSYSDLAKYLAEPTPLLNGVAENREGTGWDIYSRVVLSRPQKRVSVRQA